jgi:hypothetical protein
MSTIIPGRGMQRISQKADDNCDGSLESHCGRRRSNCLLSGQNDFRGKILFDGYSGWLIMNLDEVKHGLIILHIEHWLGPGEMVVTQNWKCENNECDQGARWLRGIESASSINATGMEFPTKERRIKAAPAVPMCDEWQFQYAIDGGPVNSWGTERCVGSYWTILDDPSVTGQNMEVAIRVTGCGNSKPLGLAHVYWS